MSDRAKYVLSILNHHNDDPSTVFTTLCFGSGLHWWSKPDLYTPSKEEAENLIQQMEGWQKEANDSTTTVVEENFDQIPTPEEHQWSEKTAKTAATEGLIACKLAEALKEKGFEDVLLPWHTTRTYEFEISLMISGIRLFQLKRDSRKKGVGIGRHIVTKFGIDRFRVAWSNIVRSGECTLGDGADQALSDHRKAVFEQLGQEVSEFPERSNWPWI